MRSSSLFALAASLSSASAAMKGFNYGSTNSDGSPKTQAIFQNEFTVAQNLVGASGFNTARLYTGIQGGSSTNQPIEAIPAAIATNTKLLLGIWASGGQDGINAEIIALKAAMSQYGLKAEHVVGLSVGSEDLYRISPTGIAAKSGYGAEPSTLVNYIGQIRSAISGTALDGVSIGHVDTWTAWVNGSNSAVIDAVDWIGVDAYPYFQNTMSNGIESNAALFNDAYSATVAVSNGKSVWITETGFPVSGPTENLAVPSIANAKTYWDEVGCANFGKVNTFWYTLYDAPSAPSFGIVGNTLSTTPLFDLSCAAVSSASASASASASTSASASASTSAPASTTSVVVAVPSVSSSTASASVSVSASASTAPLEASSGGGLGPTISAPIATTVVTTTPSVTGSASVAVPTTITTIVGAGNATTTASSAPSTTSAATSSTHTAGASIVSGSALGGALAAVVAFMAAM